MNDKIFKLSEGSAFRHMRDEDLPFVYKSWLKSYYNVLYKHIEQGHGFYDEYTPVMKQLVAQSNVKLVACDPNNPDVIQAWIVGELQPGQTPVVHYVYTKYVFRRLRLAYKLVQAASMNSSKISCSHIGRCFNEAKTKHASAVELVHEPLPNTPKEHK